jgi:two-component system, LytTR family, response regulator
MKNKLVSIGGRTKVHPAQVIALVASVNYSLAYMNDGQVLMVAIPLKSLAKRFESEAFFRTHKSFLINIKYVADYNAIDNSVLMKNKLRAAIARRKRTAFRHWFHNFSSDNFS